MTGADEAEELVVDETEETDVGDEEETGVEETEDAVVDETTVDVVTEDGADKTPEVACGAGTPMARNTREDRAIWSTRPNMFQCRGPDNSSDICSIYTPSHLTSVLHSPRVPGRDTSGVSLANARPSLRTVHRMMNPIGGKSGA